jgi:hypothetical protein
MPRKSNIIMLEPTYDLEKIRRLEAALIEYVERYGLTDSARDALEQLEGIQGPPNEKT